MNNTIEKVDKILNKQRRLSIDFGEFSKIYMMTTENIKGFLENFSLQDKEILTVAGSGDQMLNAYLMGAKNVTCFDINPLAFYQVKLKKAAVTTLNHNEYLMYCFSEFSSCLDYSLFDKISKNLDQETLSFYDYLYSNYDETDIYNKIYYQLNPRCNSLKNIQNMNSYLTSENYKKLSYILKDKEVTFIKSDITNLKDNLGDKRYDMMLLSNISDKIEDIYPGNPLKGYRKLIHSLSKNLNKDGIIQVGYIYSKYYEKVLFSDRKQRESIFSPEEFPSILILYSTPAFTSVILIVPFTLKKYFSKITQIDI